MGVQLSSHTLIRRGFTFCLCISAFVAMGLATKLAARTQSGPNPGRRMSVVTEHKVVRLVPGRSFNRRIKGGQMHSYQVGLEAGQFLHVIVDQRGIDLVATIFDPDGKKVLEANSMNGAMGPEQVRIIAEAPGDYRIDLRSWEKQARAGRYTIRIEELRAPTALDSKQFAAALVFEEGRRLNEKGTAESRKGALEKYREALVLIRETGNRYQEALVLRGIGSLYEQLSQNQQALQAHLDSLQAFQDIGNRAGEAAALNSIGEIYYSIGEERRALELFGRALTLSRAAATRGQIAMALNNVGVTYQWFGEMEKALDHFRQALDVFQELGDSQASASLNNIGFVYESVGESQMALESYWKSLQISRKTGDTQQQVITLNNTGNTHLRSGDREKALESYTLALPLARAARYNWGVATTLVNIGRVHNLLGEHQKALEYFNLALPIAETVGNGQGEAVALYSIGVAYASVGDTNKAIDNYHRAIPFSRTIEDQVAESNTLYLLARAQRQLGEVAEALLNIEAALHVLESRRSKVVNPGMRASFFARAREYYDFYIDLLIHLNQLRPDQGFDRKALHASERSRARTLLEVLAEGRIDIRHGVDPTLLDRERSLIQLIAAKTEKHSRLPDPNRSPEQAGLLKKEIEQLLAEHRRVQSQIRIASPHYAALMLPGPLTLEQIQQEVVDQDTLLLEYALGEERSHLWVVTPESINTFELPKRAEIEEAARRVYALFAGFRSRQRPGVETPRDRLSGPEYAKAATALSRMILGPVEAHLGNKRLLVVADGALSYVPFGALPDPTGQAMASQPGAAEAAGGQSLIQKHEVVYLPSASTLAVLRRNLAGRTAPPKSVAVFADPVFDANDDRVRTVPSRRRPRRIKAPVPSEALARLALERSAHGIGLTRDGKFPRLPFSRREAETICSLNRRRDALKALDFDCNKTAGLDPALRDYRILHFATHSLINSERPELSGIVMSLVDRTGRPRNGFVRLLDIYNLDLNADLIVLSACRTALGKNVGGEGLVGLTRGFMSAGAPRVVASLWKVDDQATADLMKKFYEAMLVEGERPAAALRSAQLWMQQQRRWKSPFYWAGFVVQGEWR